MSGKVDTTKVIEGKDGKSYLLFTSGWCPLSTFYPSPFKLYDVRYRNPNQFYQAMKAKEFGDISTYQMIMKAWSPRTQTDLAGSIEGFNQNKWSAKSINTMRRALTLKFDQNFVAQKFLRDTRGKEIVFVSEHQTFWGNGLRFDDEGNMDKNCWKGNNMLGQLLMELRDDVYKE